MHGHSKAKTPAAYIAELEDPRRAEIKKIDALIRKTVPKLKPHNPFTRLASLTPSPNHDRTSELLY